MIPIRPGTHCKNLHGTRDHCVPSGIFFVRFDTPGIRDRSQNRYHKDLTGDEVKTECNACATKAMACLILLTTL